MSIYIALLIRAVIFFNCTIFDMIQMKSMAYNFVEGACLLIDKPIGWTSFDVVNKVRFTLKKKLNLKKIKVGHAGTLDPLASGLLIVCTGKFTKKIDHYQGLQKGYKGQMTMGATTPSYDAETEIDQQFELQSLNPEKLHANCKSFLGNIEQKPPIFSAIKVNGQALYKKARKGEAVEIKSRQVEIMDFRLTQIELPYVDFEVKCSKGTYIRSLAHDFGRTLNNGAFLSALKRTSIGEYSLKDAWELSDLIRHIEEM